MNRDNIYLVRELENFQNVNENFFFLTIWDLAIWVYDQLHKKISKHTVFYINIV